MSAGKAFLPLLVLSLVLVPDGLAQQSLAFRSGPSAGSEPQRITSPVDMPAAIASRSSSSRAIHQGAENGGDVWRGIVTGLGVGAAAATIAAVWVSAAADLDVEEVADFYVPVVAAVGAAGGAVVEASKGAGTADGNRLRVSLGPAARGLGVSAALSF